MQSTSKPVRAGLAEARRSRSADPSRFDDELDDAGDEWQPLSPEEAAVWRARQPKAVVWRLLGWQSFAVIAGAVLMWVLDGASGADGRWVARALHAPPVNNANRRVAGFCNLGRF